MSPISNNIANFVTYMTKPDAMAPIIGLEATVTGGRTLQAQKRGGKDEARERLIEESIGAAVWLGGVKVLNDYVGDPILKKMFGKNFDVGTDKILRTPFDNFMMKNPPKKLSAKKVALIKATKVLASVLVADAFIGLVVPPLNQKLTKSLRAKNKKENEQVKSNDKLELTDKKTQNNVNFKGSAYGAINVFTHAIENNNIGKLLSTDAGLISGRMYSARNSDERREIAIRDIGSIYFYLLAQKHVGNVLNFAQSGKFSRLNPSTTNLVNEHVVDFIKNNGGEMSLEQFKKAVFGKLDSEIKLEGFNFETAELSWFENLTNKFSKNKIEPLAVTTLEEAKVAIKKNYNNEEILKRLEEMSKLQPNRKGVPVITKQQIIDAINIAEINNPKLLSKMFNQYTKGASTDEYKFVSNKKLYNLKAEVKEYLETICNNAKDGKITKDVCAKARNKNLMFNGINFAAGFVVAAAFLSTLIPKFQYWVTRMKTGKDSFPGTYEYENNNVK